MNKISVERETTNGTVITTDFVLHEDLFLDELIYILKLAVVLLGFSEEAVEGYLTDYDSENGGRDAHLL